MNKNNNENKKPSILDKIPHSEKELKQRFDSMLKQYNEDIEKYKAVQDNNKNNIKP